jgi:hypothetical protein
VKIKTAQKGGFDFVHALSMIALWKGNGIGIGRQ